MARKREKRQGHFCWACGRSRPNEKFSGKGHRRHLCKDSARLGTTRLAAIQAMRNLKRASHNGHLIRRGQRGVVENHLTHEDAEVREFAVSLHLNDVRRQLKRRIRREMVALRRNLAAEGLEVLTVLGDYEYDEQDFFGEYEDGEVFEPFLEPAEDGDIPF